MKLENSIGNFDSPRNSRDEQKRTENKSVRRLERKLSASSARGEESETAGKWNLRKFAVNVGVWSALGLLFTPQTYLVNLSSPTPLNWRQAFVSTMFPFLLWTILTPPIFGVCNRFPLENRQLLKRVLIHFLFSLPFAAAQYLLMEFGEHLFLPWAEGYVPPIPPVALIVSFLANNIMFYWGIVAVNHAVNYFRKYQDGEFRLVEAQMQALKTQLNPHFLFNTLNAISELVYTSPANADKTIAELSDLLRVALENDTAQEVPLIDEIEFLEKYLNIQQTLLDKRLKVQITVGRDAYDALVPNMILQPLAENAIRHGLASRAAGGIFSFSAERRGGRLEIVVRDDGVGFQTSEQTKNGVGLTNTRARLEHLYGENHRFDLQSAKESGTEIKITIPFTR